MCTCSLAGEHKEREFRRVITCLTIQRQTVNPRDDNIRLAARSFVSLPTAVNLSTMTTYKLTYFNITGLGESIRLMLHYGGVKFEDVRLSFDEWPKHKPDMPMGQIPVLEIDGKKYCQSMAILRYLAKKFDLYGKDDIEALEIDATADSISDLRIALSTWYWEKNAEAKERLKVVAFTKLTETLDRLNAQVKKNGGYLVGGKMSYADILYAGLNGLMSHGIGYDLNKDHPELQKLVDRVFANPNIKAYLEKRPKTDF